MINAFVATIFIMFSSATFSSEKTSHYVCSLYDWGKVEALVEPYLDEYLMTALIQQGGSAEYRTSVAADQALGSASFPAHIEAVLISLSKHNC